MKSLKKPDKQTASHSMPSIDIQSKTGLVVIGTVFAAGTVFGWYLKTWRLQWLAKKRVFFARRAQKAQDQIEGNSDSSTTVLVS